MHDFTPYSALLGDAIIGLAAVLLLLAHGRIAGISGLLGGILRGADKCNVRLAFIAGLLGGGFTVATPAAESRSCAIAKLRKWRLQTGQPVNRLNCKCVKSPLGIRIEP